MRAFRSEFVRCLAVLSLSLVVFATRAEAQWGWCNNDNQRSCFRNGVGTACSQYCDSLEIIEYYQAWQCLCKTHNCYWWAWNNYEGGQSCDLCITDYFEYCVLQA
jgi:hypothetical protein